MSHRMTRNRPFLAVALAAGLSLAGCAASGPQAPKGPQDALIGYWQVEGGGTGETVAQFCEDGTFRVFVRSSEGSSRHSGKFEVNGQQIRFAEKTQADPSSVPYAVAGDRLQYSPASSGNPAWMVSDTWRRMSR